MRNLLAFFSVIALFFPCTAQAEPAIAVYEAWIRSAPPGATTLAAYMLIRNGSGEQRRLTAVSCGRFREAEIHRTEIKEGVARMVPQKDLVIPAGETVVLEPGGYHLMLLQPVSVPTEGEHVDLELFFDDGQKALVKAEVRGGGGTGNGHHH